MTASYFYLVSGLPAITIGEKLPIPLADTLATCRNFLPPKEMELLEKLDLLTAPSKEYPESIRQYLAWEQAMRNRLVFLRTYKVGIDPDTYLRSDSDVFASVENYIHEFFNLPVLEKEQKLDQFRWVALEHITAPEHFNFAALCAYKIKALIAEKWDMRKPETGKANLEALVDTVTGKVPSLNFSHQTDKEKPV